MKIQIINNYYVAGNENLAIAINTKNEKDAHYFIMRNTGDPDDFKQTAWEQAVVWTSPGI